MSLAAEIRVSVRDRTWKFGLGAYIVHVGQRPCSECEHCGGAQALQNAHADEDGAGLGLRTDDRADDVDQERGEICELGGQHCEIVTVADPVATHSNTFGLPLPTDSPIMRGKCLGPQ